ncbi:MAG: class I poly(R)-hydroxyalkanoic acid synthase [Alphaproteobacteria bacterium]|nr:class I poly(R)-hydroxyalkanoic acid synthase [Alphaproteobacteria bacterium]
MVESKSDNKEKCLSSAQDFAQNLQKIGERSQQLLEVYMQSQQEPEMNDSLHISNAFLQLFERMLSDPTKIWEIQMAWWQSYMELWNETAKSFAGEPSRTIAHANPKDRRFKDKAWQENVVFDFLKQSYLLASDHLQQMVEDVEGLEPHTRQKIEFYTRQYVDAMSPSNFLMTNPEVLRTTLESGGENLVSGLENMLEDLKRGKGKLHINMTDTDAFTVGKNLGITKGSVIFQNALMQLIQYEPTTEKVHKTPILVMPAWINKYYILDLKPENSLVKWLTDQGYTVFIISWVNPDAKMSQKTFEDYMNQGPLAALDAIESATGETQVSAIGYCLGGTLLASTLAYLHATKKSSRIVSATYLTTMVDFADSGELSVFIDEDQIQALENKMQKQGGMLQGSDMATTFNLLRANDLIWSFVVNNYLLGKDPFPFDLLYWNSDSTRMPMVMHSFYLRKMYQENLLVKKGGIVLNDTPLDLSAIDTPSYVLSTREDHIAPWQATYRATQIYQGDVRFVLAASGHVAGVINPPVKNKYCFWTKPDSTKQYPDDTQSFLAVAKEHSGSWWNDWLKWHAPYNGKKVAARKVGDGKLKPIEDAPGSYVKMDK